MKVYVCTTRFFCSGIDSYINIGDYVYVYENVEKVAIRGVISREYNELEYIHCLWGAVANCSFFEFIRSELEDDAGGGVCCQLPTEVLAIPVEYGNNPVLDPTSDRAYYPSVLYFEDGFTIGGTPYKYVCIYSGDVDAGGGLIISGSNDFKTWIQLNDGDPLIGLPSTAHHCCVIKTGDTFRIYYWNSSLVYSVAAIRTAVSDDLINWIDDQPLQNGVNSIITGVWPDWNRGSYGPCDCIYNATATNTGTNPFDYSYALYFDGTNGSFESIGLGYSEDGITFNLYGLVLDHSSTIWGKPTPWDTSYVTSGKILKTQLGKWMMFYSGGVNAASEGVGVAISDDGLTWYKLTTSSSLITTISGTWRDNRAYAVSIISDFENRFVDAGDEVDVKMLVSGRNSSGDYTCGYFNIPYLYADVKDFAYRLGKL